MSVPINPVVRRVQFTGNTSTGPFAFSFNILAATDISVHKNAATLTLTNDYSVSISSNGTGSISLGVALQSSDVLTIIGGRELSRTTDFVTAGDLLASSLNEQLDSNVIMAQQLDEKINRSLFLDAGDVSTNLKLPVKNVRKGTVLGFNATSGDPEVGPKITAVQSLANVTAAINVLGTTAAVEDLSILGTAAIVEDMSILGTSGNVTAMGLLGVSAVITDMGILGTAAIVEDMALLGTSGNVSAMALLGTSAAVADMAILGTSAIVADMAILGTDDVVADMNILGSSDVVTDMNLLATAAVIEDMGLLATSANVAAMGNIGTSANVTSMGLLGTSAVVTDMGILGTAAIVEDMSLLGTSANVTSMGLLGTSAVVEDLGLLATSAVIEDMGLLATSAVIGNMGLLGTSGNVTAMGNVGGSITNVNTVASNVAGVNSFAERYRIASSAPSSSLNVGDLYFDTSANELKVYKSSGWAAAGSTVNGTSARFHYDITGTPTTVSGSDANSNTLAYDAGFIDVYVNGVRMSPADITTTSGSSVVFASALAAGDEVDIVAFGTFAVANIVATGALNSGSITSGFGTINNGASTITTTGVGSFGSLDISGAIDVDGTTNLDVVDIDGAVDMALTLAVTGVVTANAGVVVDNITIDGQEIDVSSGDLTLDVAGDIFLDAGGDNIKFLYGGTTYLDFYKSGSSIGLYQAVQDGDFLFQGNDGGASITALTLDMSNAGAATFNSQVSADNYTVAAGGVYTTAAGNDLNIVYPDGRSLFVKEAGTTHLTVDNVGTLIVGGTTKVSHGQSIPFQAGEGGNFFTIQRNDGQDVLEVNTKTDTAVTRTHFALNNSNGTVGTIQTQGSGVAYNTSSDHRLKENVDYSWDATTRLKQLKPARFNFIADADTTVDGFLAHEAQAVVPECVTGTHNETQTLTKVVLSSSNTVLAENIEQSDWTAGKSATTDEDGNAVAAIYPSDSTWAAEHVVPKMQGIDQSKLVPLLAKTIIELEARITALEA